jgi:predicted  nucleic acid-binding Zn-ribbon protein
MELNWIEILGLIGGTGGIATLLTLGIERRTKKAQARQEEARGNQEDVKAKKDLADLEREIYERIVSTMQSQFDNQSKEIKELKDTQKDLLKTIEIQDGNIKHLQETVNEYKQTCDDCQFRISKKVVKVVGK